MTPTKPAIWEWSPDDVAVFYKAAFIGKGRVRIREGLSAVFQATLPRMLPRFVQTWCDLLTREGQPVRWLTLRHPEHPEIEYTLPVDRAFLYKAMNIIVEEESHATQHSGDLEDGSPNPSTPHDAAILGHIQPQKGIVDESAPETGTLPPLTPTG